MCLVFSNFIINITNLLVIFLFCYSNSGGFLGKVLAALSTSITAQCIETKLMTNLEMKVQGLIFKSSAGHFTSDRSFMA